MSTHSSGSLESLHSCHVQFHAFQSSKLLVKVPQSLLTDAVCPLPDQSELSKLMICCPMTAHLATMTLKRTRGRSWTQMGKSSMPALPRHSRAHMFSQFLRVMLVTITWQWSGVSLSTLHYMLHETLFGLRASSHVMFSLTGVLSKATCSSIHSRNALK